ncbi:MAG: cobalamin biosynthesis protein P47K, partial [Verrucomicrobiae bacterium]|nr:cobalamin biosynthesis protein P47K [Verrucomicrobiae bacterium]
MTAVHFIMIGGFLGAGKTTAILRLAARLASEGRSVGLITNDQGQALVDTTRMRAAGLHVEEIAGGCFCCRFNSLIEALRRLSTTLRPDVFIAEPVGSCTDVVATVTFPLRRLYGNNYKIAPLSVLVDPIRALRVFGQSNEKKFSEKVLYIYRKQLEEADIIVINKSDLLDPRGRESLRRALGERFTRAEIFECSARTGAGLDAWFDRILTAEQEICAPVEVDYTTYGEGEQLLGWLNVTATVRFPEPHDGNRLLLDLANRFRNRLAGEIAHLKMTLTPPENPFDVASLSLSRNDELPELTHRLMEP